MSHDYHENLPGFDPSQILVDHCAECEERSRRGDLGIANLDAQNFRRAVERAREWNRYGLASISDAEMPLLRVLSAVSAQFERVGVSL